MKAIQGDIKIDTAQTLPRGAKKRDGNVIVEGETTGHAHRLADGDVYTYGKDLYLQTYVPTTIIHDEHNPIPLETPGLYRVKRQREYVTRDMVRLVVD